MQPGGGKPSAMTVPVLQPASQATIPLANRLSDQGALRRRAKQLKVFLGTESRVSGAKKKPRFQLRVNLWRISVDARGKMEIFDSFDSE